MNDSQRIHAAACEIRRTYGDKLIGQAVTDACRSTAARYKVEAFKVLDAYLYGQK